MKNLYHPYIRFECGILCMKAYTDCKRNKKIKSLINVEILYITLKCPYTWFRFYYSITHMVVDTYWIWMPRKKKYIYKFDHIYPWEWNRLGIDVLQKLCRIMCQRKEKEFGRHVKTFSLVSLFFFLLDWLLS